jgi:DNA-binding MurR/RpiR family transcriptional regulator
MTQSENIFSCISNSYYHFTAAEKKVADYVLSHKTGVQYMSISELAEECGVAEATVSRFCRRLRLKGYNAFKLALAKDTAEPQEVVLEGQEGEIGPDDTISELCRKLYTAQIAAIGQSMALVQPDQISAAVDLLCAARRVYCMGQGGSMILAHEAAHFFSTISPNFFSVSDSHSQVSTAALLGAEDVILFFSYSGSTKEMLELMSQAKKNGTKLILITRFSKSPGAAMADVTLQCGSNEGPLQLSSIPAKMAQLYLVDVLYNEYVRRSPERARENQGRVAEALAEKHL